MRILLQGLQAGNRSGTGRYTIELARALAKLEEGPELVCLWPDDLAEPIPGGRVEVIRRRSGFTSRFLCEQVNASRLARNLGADLVHFPASVAGATGNTPMVVTVHDVCYKSHPEWFPYTRVLYYDAFMGAGIRRAARVIADSKRTAEDINRFYGIPESRIDVIPLGVEACFSPADAEMRRRLRERYSLPATFFLFLGTLEPRKNLAGILEAWSRMSTTMPDLVIAGRTGWKTDLKRLVSGHLDERRLHCLGHVPQELLPALYSEAIAFVWPSLMEGFGLPLLEAMACGTPVITSDSMKEVAGDGALYVDPLDAQAIFRAMTDLSENEQLCRMLREQGRNHAAKYRWESTAELTCRTYERAFLDSGRSS